jgi:hypothetical protein
MTLIAATGKERKGEIKFSGAGRRVLRKALHSWCVTFVKETAPANGCGDIHPGAAGEHFGRA